MKTFKTNWKAFAMGYMTGLDIVVIDTDNYTVTLDKDQYCRDWNGDIICNNKDLSDSDRDLLEMVLGDILKYFDYNSIVSLDIDKNTPISYINNDGDIANKVVGENYLAIMIGETIDSKKMVFTRKGLLTDLIEKYCKHEGLVVL